ncbi:chromatin modification-related protein YNG2-like [Acyrthosiphon pisum]|uniref:PHD-type domain-containing protein n=1 Tax=Acyrthosiphon pisum TaxID=7029 RepID=A0A8R2JMC3_ACYPI|nr:chromatin modification-related protein YNG2-like [Acyrthosiphon pisum]
MDDVENEDLGNYNRQDNYPDNDIVYGNDKTMDAGCSENINNQGIKSIILPGKVRTCGRPKGAILTTIGLRRPRTKRTLAQKPETKIQKKGNRDIAVDPDEPTYCLCVQISYGEMICCDNDSCPIEWFHFSCVSLLTKPKGKWFCPRCRGDRPNKIKPKA